jgi:RsiW-degrading membrane proteinase PrsW (M82 family)
MYLYYLLTCFNIRPVWGKYLTQLQMLQFMGMVAQAVPLVVQDCPFPRRFAALYLAYAVSLLVLFRVFYRKRWAAKGGRPPKSD